MTAWDILMHGNCTFIEKIVKSSHFEQWFLSILGIDRRAKKSSEPKTEDSEIFGPKLRPKTEDSKMAIFGYFGGHIGLKKWKSVFTPDPTKGNEIHPSNFSHSSKTLFLSKIDYDEAKSRILGRAWAV